MKKTLTVNLGGTVFHIDEDAYNLLDNYLKNLRLHFRRQEGAEEIVDDIENRISELFTEKVNGGSQVISIEYVEEVMSRVGKPEELGDADEGTTAGAGATGEPGESSDHAGGGYAHKRLYRDADNKILGGVVSGLAEYMNWDVTLLRLIVVIILVAGMGIVIPIYIACWIAIPEAVTAAEKLNMRGEEVTVENIGRTVKDGFERMANGVNDYMQSDKPRTFLQQLGDALVMIIGFMLKALLVLVALVCSPVLFVLIIVFILLIVAIVAAAIGGGTMLYSAFPIIDWAVMADQPIVTLATSIAGILVVGIPLASIVFVILRQVFHWEPMAVGFKWALIILWFAGVVIFLLGLIRLDWYIPYFLAMM